MLLYLPLDWLYSYLSPEPEPPATWWQKIMEVILTLRDNLAAAFHSLLVYMFDTLLPNVTQGICYLITQTRQAMYAVCEMLHLCILPWLIEAGKHIFHGCKFFMDTIWEYFLYAACFTGIHLQQAWEFSKELFTQTFEYSKELFTQISEFSKELFIETRNFTYAYIGLVWNQLKKYIFVMYAYFSRFPPVKLVSLGAILVLMICCTVVLIQLCKNRRKYWKPVKKVDIISQDTASQDASVLTGNGHQGEHLSCSALSCNGQQGEDLSCSATQCNGDSPPVAAAYKKHGK